MLDQFANPPSQYRLAPFWAWNEIPDPIEIDRQVREMHAKGLGGFIIDGRFAGPVSDAGEELLRLTQRACEAAERLGLRIYQYDEPPPIPGLPPLLDIKLRTSAVHAQGRIRALARAPYASDWSCSMDRMKRDVDRLACLGVNFFCPDAFHYSVAGLQLMRPRSQFYQATYWRDYKRFADYAARLSYVMSQGRHVPQAALLRPGGFADRMERDLVEWLEAYCQCLLAEHIDFDIIDERSLAQAAIEEDRLVLGAEGYELLILPPVPSVAWKTADKIKVFADQGGKLIGTSRLPAEDADGDRHEEVREAFAMAFEPGTHAHLLQISRLSDLAPALDHALRATVKRDVSIRRESAECADIVCAHRATDSLDIFLLANSAAQAREVRISVRCDGAPHMLNLETGECTALPNCTQQGNRTVLLHRFEAHGSLVMVFGDEPVFAVSPPIVEGGQEIALSEEWEFVPEQPNCLTLRDWSFNTLIQQDRELYEYTTSFDAQFVPDDLILAFQESPDFHVGDGLRLFVNDTEVAPTGSWAIDISIRVFNMASVAREGLNSIRMVAEREGWTGEPVQTPVRPRLLGSFSAAQNGSLQPPRTSLRDGSWTDQGYPFYSGTAAYRQTVFIPEFARGQKVILRCEQPSDYVEFLVNGRLAGLRPWAPFEVDITSLVVPGKNTIELRVTNSLANMMLSEPRPSGLTGGATLFLA